MTLPPFAVVVDGSPAPSGAVDIRAVRRVATRTSKPNFTFRVDDAVAGLPRQLESIELDWLDLLAALYAADLACDRGEGDTNWGRRITVSVPLRQPDHWVPLVPALQGIFADLTYDTLHVEISQATSPAGPPRLRTDPFPDPDCVALVSGGLDSFAGALNLHDQGRRPLLLSHAASGVVGGSQIAVTQALADRDPNIEAVRFTAKRASQMDFPGRENSQRARTLLYMGVGALLAAVLEIEDLFVNENGVMAVHVPMTEARVGSLSTRTAAPRVLERMSDLASRALGHRIVVKNELIGLTKPEVVERIVKLGAGDLIPQTVSCWKMSRQSQHCGYCAPCLIRRISCEIASAADVSNYELDVFNDRASHDHNDQVRDNLTHMAQYVIALDELDGLALVDEYPEIISTGSALTRAQSIDLHKRWGRQAMHVLAGQPATAYLVA